MCRFICPPNSHSSSPPKLVPRCPCFHPGHHPSLPKNFLTHGKFIPESSITRFATDLLEYKMSKVLLSAQIELKKRSQLSGDIFFCGNFPGSICCDGLVCQGSVRLGEVSCILFLLNNSGVSFCCHHTFAEVNYMR